MQAEAVLALWRRVLRSEALQHEILCGGDGPGTDCGLSADERSIAAVFAAHRAAARWPIEGYRFRLIEQWVTDLERGARATAAVLRAHGHELGSLVTRYLRSHGWPDPGHYAMGACRDWLAFVASDLDPAPPGLADLIAVESLLLDRLIALAEVPPGEWQTPAALPRHGATVYRQSPAAGAITVGHDLRAWLADPGDPAASLQREVAHYAVLIESPDRAPEVVALDDAEKSLFDAFAVPAALGTVLARPPSGTVGMAAAFDALLELGLIRPSGELCRQ